MLYLDSFSLPDERTETKNVQLYHAFFASHAHEFGQNVPDLSDFLDSQS